MPKKVVAWDEKDDEMAVAGSSRLERESNLNLIGFFLSLAKVDQRIRRIERSRGEKSRTPSKLQHALLTLRCYDFVEFDHKFIKFSDLKNIEAE